MTEIIFDLTPLSVAPDAAEKRRALQEVRVPIARIDIEWYLTSLGSTLREVEYYENFVLLDASSRLDLYTAYYAIPQQDWWWRVYPDIDGGELRGVWVACVAPDLTGFVVSAFVTGIDALHILGIAGADAGLLVGITDEAEKPGEEVAR